MSCEAWPAPRPQLVLPDLVRTDPEYRRRYEQALLVLRASAGRRR